MTGSLSRPHAGRRGRVGAVIVAAGRSARMNGVDKLFVPLHGRLLLAHTVAAFEACPAVDDIVLVVASDNLARAQALVGEEGWRKVRRVCAGGARRRDSVRAGLDVLPACQWVIVHDGARPCVEVEVIERGLAEARRTGAAIAAVPVKDTVKVVDGERRILDTPERERLWSAQTPQAFRYDLLARAHAEVGGDVTDDAALVERLGHPVVVFMGSYRNIKVTTPEDLAVAEAWLGETARRGRA